MKNYIVNKISLENTIIYKGLFMLLIIWHNAIHPLFRPDRICNEINYSFSRIVLFIDTLKSGDLSLFSNISSFLGYVGVIIFLFFTGYGLTLSLEKKNESYKSFLFKRIIKIYIPIIFASIFILLTISIIGINYGTIKNFNIWEFIFLRFFMLGNFYHEAIFPGPWWYLGTTIQFYIIFHLIYMGYKKYGLKILIYISLFSYLFVFLSNLYLQDFILAKYLVIGWLPEFSLGIYLASTPEIKISMRTKLSLIIITFLIFVLGQVNSIIWLFSSTSCLIFLVLIMPEILKLIDLLKLKKVFIYLGNISVYLFLLNGFIREPFIEMISRINIMKWWYIDLNACAILAITVICSAFLKNIENIVRNKMKN